MKFIKDKDFEKHVGETFKKYIEASKLENLEQFNSNLVDPVKLLFDNIFAGDDWNKVIENEVFRQSDKTKNNIIGYFHQNLFKYIDGCVVPDKGFDIIYKDEIFVELKNKFNTMNSSSSRATWEKMERELAKDSSKKYFLVEVIARQSQDIPWKLNNKENENIRRVSYDRFLSMITGEDDALEQILDKLNEILLKWSSLIESDNIEENSILKELKEIDGDVYKSLRKLAFRTYISKYK